MDDKVVFVGYTTFLAFSINLVLTPIILGLAIKKEWFDPFDSRKIHTGKIPRIGGIGIFGSFIFTLLIISFSLDRIGGSSVWTTRYAPLILCLIIANFLGLIDDFRNIKANIKLLFQILIACIVIIAGFRFKSILLPVSPYYFDLGWVSYPLTFLWIIGITNAINLIDGIDGFAGSVSFLSSLVVGIYFFFGQDLVGMVFAFAVIGALVGFLFYNLPPAKIFMGDSGSLFLGFALAVFPLMGLGVVREPVNIVSMTTLLAIPIFDVFFAIIRRLKMKVSFMTPDRGHVHHRLLNFGFGTKGSLAILCLLQGILCLAALSQLYWMHISFYLNIGAWLLTFAFFLVANLVPGEDHFQKFVRETSASETMEKIPD